MEPERRTDATDLRADWADRERWWARRLGRLRLGAEPIEEQVARHRRATWVLTGVTLVVASMFVAIFSAFERPDLGAGLAAALFAPVLAIAWIDFGRLRGRAGAYLRDREAHGPKPTTPAP